MAFLVSVLETFLGVVVLAVIAAVSLVPAATGWVPLTVLTGSMNPGIPPGSLIVVKSVTTEEANQLQIGQVATYLPEADSDLLVTHRIVRARALDDGTAQYEFKGDANNAPDPQWVKPKQIRGVLQYHVPFLGRVLTLLRPSTKEAWRTVAALGLAVYALWEGAGAVIEWRRDKRKARQRTPDAAQAGPENPQAPDTTEAGPSSPLAPEVAEAGAEAPQASGAAEAEPGSPVPEDTDNQQPDDADAVAKRCGRNHRAGGP